MPTLVLEVGQFTWMMSSVAQRLASCLSATVDQSCHIIAFTLLMLVLVVKVRTYEEAACVVVALLNFAVKRPVSLLPKYTQLAQWDNCDWWAVVLQMRVESRSV